LLCGRPKEAASNKVATTAGVLISSSTSLPTIFASLLRHGC
jgi:hypothetical protein